MQIGQPRPQHGIARARQARGELADDHADQREQSKQGGAPGKVSDRHHRLLGIGECQREDRYNAQSHRQDQGFSVRGQGADLSAHKRHGGKGARPRQRRCNENQGDQQPISGRCRECGG